MGKCNCKTNQQISYLQRKYGNNIPQSKSTKIGEMVSVGIKNFLLILLMVPLFPFFLIFLIIRHIFTKKPINIKKTFKINE